MTTQSGSTLSSADEAPARPLRRDAELNRQKILRAAAEVFATRGLEVTLDDIAAHAGVGVGTVYRRFPDKDSLAEALFEDKIDRMVALAEEAARQDDSWSALTEFLSKSAMRQAQDRGLRQALHNNDVGKLRLAEARSRLIQPLSRLIESAKAQGHLRRDFQLTDIPMILLMTSVLAQYAGGADPEIWRRYLDFVINGLGDRPGLPPASRPALSEDQLVTAMRQRNVRGC